MTRASKATSAPAFVIEKGVPMPEHNKRHTGLTAALLKLEIDDSIFVKCGKHELLGTRLVYAKRKSGRHFTQRTVEGGVRVWRVS